MVRNFVKKIKFPTYSDERGNLTIMESIKNIPFDIKRLFFIYDVKDNKNRGNHANKFSEFIMVALKGKVKVKINNGYSAKQLLLNKPNEGIYISKMTWKEMFDFSDDCILLVVASELYNKDEYIYDYKEFEKEVKKYYEKDIDNNSSLL